MSIAARPEGLHEAIRIDIDQKDRGSPSKIFNISASKTEPAALGVEGSVVT
jgi:hypothetical protein